MNRHNDMAIDVRKTPRRGKIKQENAHRDTLQGMTGSVNHDHRHSESPNAVKAASDACDGN